MERARANIALSEQVKEDIIELIQSSDGSNNKLPPESELARQFGVSVAVVREALLLLSLEGVVTKKHGSGNYYHRTMLLERDQYLGRMPGYLTILRAQGHQPTVGLPYCEKRIPPKEIRERLGLAEGDDAFFYSRMIYVDGVPAVCGTNWLPAKLFHRFPADSERMFNVFDLIQHYMQEDIAYGDSEFIPAVAGELDAQQLSIPLGSAFMIQNGVYYSFQNKPLAYSSDKLNPAFMRIRILARP
ncbi:GntR family transcriptional regulator [Pseudoflavonifractor sp. 524-17]|uniref:GntR family transcriptional regulator n=1 Tax=Pseudoflavonifractor sp. 524-17 TaxID=2304577 RepID=UPI0013798F72|nr:GntR family transcriptional regulator [Pseudoflavonifractor sp. 524-17]NCE65750.1 GntR family transcriptional regulator [Pseudoflavonifractor sp. 524-17]